MDFSLTTQRIDPCELGGRMRQTHAGAYVSFEGWVRDHHEGRAVAGLSYQVYAPLAEKEGQAILAEARARFAIDAAQCLHRHGHVPMGEAAVWVGVTAAHRDAAFAACRYIIDSVKARVPIWKHERYEDGTAAWVGCAGCHSHAHSEDSRYARQQALPGFGAEGQQRLAKAHVLLLGLGGLGCPAADLLVGAGLGRLTLVDPDRVDRSNLHRQSLYTEDEQGQWKAEAAAARLQQRNAQVQIQALRQRLDSESLRKLIASADLVIDATDDAQSKQQSSSLARAAGVPWALAGLERQTGGIYLSPTPVEQGVCWNCLVGQGGMACSERGVLGPTPAVLGALLAQAALSQLLGWDNGWAGHWTVFDLSGARLLRLQAQQRAECLCAPTTVKEVHSLDAQRQWVDLRNAAERAALPLPGATLLQELEEAAAWDRLRPYTLICTRGQRSARAAAQMQAMGFVDVASLAGGLVARERSA